jgi:CHAT domain-containing protein/tetratricopeptide (TPR) repeat protein
MYASDPSKPQKSGDNEEQATQVVYEIIDSESNLRQGPGGGFKVIRKSQKGETGICLEIKNGWKKLQVSDGSIAWIHEQNLKICKIDGKQKKLDEKSNGALSEVQKLDNEAEKLYANCEYDKALALRERALAIREKTLGALHPDVAKNLLEIAWCYLGEDDADNKANAKALPLKERALAIYEKAHGHENFDAIDALRGVALSYWHVGEYAKSLSLKERLLGFQEKKYGLNSEVVRMEMSELAHQYEYIHNYTRALFYLELLEKNSGSDDLNPAYKLQSIANVYSKMGDYAKALMFQERALTISKKEHGPEGDPLILNDLGHSYSNMGDYAKALLLHERALAINEKKLEPQHRGTQLHSETIENLRFVADTYSKMGEHSKALSLHERALEIAEKEFGENIDSEYFLSLADTYSAMGDFTKAHQLRVRALPYILFRYFYDFSITLPLKAKDLEAIEKGGEPDTAMKLLRIANSYLQINDYAKCLQIQESALAILEKVLGAQHPNTATSLSDLANTYFKIGEYAKAQPLQLRALEIREKVLGMQHPETATSLNDLANIYSMIGDYTKALPMQEQAFTIREKGLGLQHPKTAASLMYLADNYYRAENLNMSRMYASKAIAATHRQLQSILSLDEKARLSWQKENLSYWYACVLRADPLAELSLRWKGVVLDSLLEDRTLTMAADKDPEGAALLDEMRMLRGKLAKVAIEKDSDAEVASIEKRIGQIQVSMAKRAHIGGRVRSSVDMTIDAVVPALAQGSLLVDFIRFSDPKLKGDEAACYGAIMTGGDASPRFVRIDGAVAIDLAVDDLRSAIVQSNEKMVEEKTAFLSEKIWKPLSAQIPLDTKQLIICPEAKLNFLSISALLDQDGRFIAEKYPIAYVGSARDLARKSSSKFSKNLAIYAAPVFDAKGSHSASKDNLTIRSAEADVFGAIYLPPLPGTEAEAKTIQSIANDVAWSTKVVTGHEATEESVRASKDHAVLHLATHGFYLNSFALNAPADTRGMSVIGNTENVAKQDRGVDPMRASGVALTGATQTLKQWSQRKAPDSETDGILTADEVASLNLDGTWLVTLSACETGVGEARNGEGVFGLRRAFMMAGAENLLMTLWPVSDNTTAEIMESFYKEALPSHDAIGSLAKVQRDWLVKLRKEKGLLVAVRDAAPFAMVTMTAPTHPPVTFSTMNAPVKASK